MRCCELVRVLRLFLAHASPPGSSWRPRARSRRAAEACADSRGAVGVRLAVAVVAAASRSLIGAAPVGMGCMGSANAVSSASLGCDDSRGRDLRAPSEPRASSGRTPPRRPVGGAGSRSKPCGAAMPNAAREKKRAGWRALEDPTEGDRPRSRARRDGKGSLGGNRSGIDRRGLAFDGVWSRDRRRGGRGRHIHGRRRSP